MARLSQKLLNIEYLNSMLNLDVITLFLYFNSNLSSFTTLRGKKTQKFEFLLQFSPFMFINTFTKVKNVK